MLIQIGAKLFLPILYLTNWVGYSIILTDEGRTLCDIRKDEVTMRLEKKTTIHLSSDDVANIVASYIENEYKMDVNRIEVRLSKKYNEDYDERYQFEILCFDGFALDCTKKEE